MSTVIVGLAAESATGRRPPARFRGLIVGEKQFQAELDAMEAGLYAKLEAEARAALGTAPRRNKPLVARFVAESLIERGAIPPFVRSIVEKLSAKAAAA